MTSPAGFIDRVRSEVDAALRNLETRSEPNSLYESVRYVLSGGGKRFRPLLVYCASDMFDGADEVTIAAALSVEVFHSFTLVHDDIMDQSGQRRGRPTVHVKWDVPTAILCGDYLHGLSHSLLGTYPRRKLGQALRYHSEAVRELCEGQVRDMEFEQRPVVELDDYLSMIDRKTGALFRLSLKLGALAGACTDDLQAQLDEIGMHLGRAFQIQDDLLDLTAENDSWGKPVGGDLVTGKKTWLSIVAAERAESAAPASDIDYEDFARKLRTPGAFSIEDIHAVTEIMERLDVLNDARSSVIFHSDEAQGHLDCLPDSVGRDVLRDLIDRMQRRYH